MKTLLLPEIQNTVDSLVLDNIPEERKKVLQGLINYLKEKITRKQEIRLNFICTHNSRRSQLSQVWAQTAATYYGIETSCYSGGTETTEFNYRAVQALKEAGFRVTKKGETNPVYFIIFSEEEEPVAAFSKIYDDAINPRTGFAAVMTCSSADENCPFIPGAEARIPLLYEDPKEFDGTPLESEKYRERSLQIATEMFYIFSRVNSKE